MKKNEFGGTTLSKFFVEVVTIIFGVLLALGVNELRQFFKDETLANTALNSIKIEIENNKSFLGNRLPYYKSMLYVLCIKTGRESTLS